MRSVVEVVTACVVLAAVLELAAGVALFVVDQPAAAWLSLSVGLLQVCTIFVLLVLSLVAAAREEAARAS